MASIHSQNLSSLFSNINPLELSDSAIEQLAFETRFRRRNSGKISPKDMLIRICAESINGSLSFNDLAYRMKLIAGVDASPQAYAQRTTQSCLDFFKKVLEIVMAKQMNPSAVIQSTGIQRILVQDSTVIALPQRLFPEFSGVRNAHKAVCNARVQTVYDLISMRFVYFSIDSYSHNDLKAASDYPAEPGDLLLRDRGYFVPEVFKKTLALGGDLITRYKHKTNMYFSQNSNEPIQLLRELKKLKKLDREIWVGSDKKHRCKLRLIASPIPQAIADERRRKARKQMNGKSPSKELLELMGWQILLTSYLDPELDICFFNHLYALRWRIENIFRSWKSDLAFAHVHNVSEIQLRILLTARFIMHTIIQQHCFVPLSFHIKKQTGRRLSLMKFTRTVQSCQEMLNWMLTPKMMNDLQWDTLVRYCCYTKRKRKNHVEQFEAFIAEIKHYSLA